MCRPHLSAHGLMSDPSHMSPSHVREGARYPHVCPAVLSYDVDGLEVLPGRQVHLGRRPRLLAALGPVRLLGHQHPSVLRVGRTDKLLRGRTGEEKGSGWSERLRAPRANEHVNSVGHQDWRGGQPTCKGQCVG